MSASRSAKPASEPLAARRRTSVRKACSAEFVATGAELDRLLGANLSEDLEFKAVQLAVHRYALESMGCFVKQRFFQIRPQP